MPVEEFYATRKKRYDGFCVPNKQPLAWLVDDFYQTLETMWQMPDVCGEKVAAAQAATAVVADTRTLEERFTEQAEKWDRETAHLSAPAQRFAHPSYLAILGMANDNRDEVIDLLLRDMQKNRREWFWALSYLTHENPIDRKDAGRLDKMIQAWVRWGQTQRRGRR
jgi:hypothetical protein